MILERSETGPITIRDTKDCFHLYEVRLSRVTKQVIGPRIPRSWLEHVDDESWDVVLVRMKLKVGFRKISFILALPSNPSLNKITARSG